MLNPVNYSGQQFLIFLIFWPYLGVKGDEREYPDSAMREN